MQIGFSWGAVCVQAVLLVMTTFNIWTRKIEANIGRLHCDQLYEQI